MRRHVRAMECSTAAECRRLNARGRADEPRWRREAEDADAAEAGGLRAVPVAALEAAVSALTPSGRPLLVHSEERRRSASRSRRRRRRPTGWTTPRGSSRAPRRGSARRPRPHRLGRAAALVLAPPPDARLRRHRRVDARRGGVVARARHRRARRARPRLTAGTCPHYAVYAAEDAERGDTRLKAAPPLRSRANRDALWRGLVSGEVRLASDHTPTTLERRAGPSSSPPPASRGCSSRCPPRGRRRRRTAPTSAICRNGSRGACAPRRAAAQGGDRGGRDADLVVWSPDTPDDCATVYHRQPGSPYEEAALHGRVRHTLLRGRSVFSDGQHPDNACGEVLLGSTQ